MKHNTKNAGKKISSEFSIELFENIPSTVSLIDRYKFEDKRLTDKVLNTNKSANRKMVTLKLGTAEHVSSHRNIF